jgi:hypothetical protein
LLHLIGLRLALHILKIDFVATGFKHKAVITEPPVSRSRAEIRRERLDRINRIDRMGAFLLKLGTENLRGQTLIIHYSVLRRLASSL